VKLRFHEMPQISLTESLSAFTLHVVMELDTWCGGKDSSYMSVCLSQNSSSKKEAT
jgi:hypothetical protein